MSRRADIAADEVLLFTKTGKASLHHVGCPHLIKYSTLHSDGTWTWVPKNSGVVVYADVQAEVDDLVERGYKIRRASCLRPAVKI